MQHLPTLTVQLSKNQLKILQAQEQVYVVIEIRTQTCVKGLKRYRLYQLLVEHAYNNYLYLCYIPN